MSGKIPYYSLLHVKLSLHIFLSPYTMYIITLNLSDYTLKKLPLRKSLNKFK